MLNPRTLSEKRDEIVESCRRRGVHADVDGVIAAQGKVAAEQTALNELNRERNEHQKSGKQKLSSEERKTHANEGRRLKEMVRQLWQVRFNVRVVELFYGFPGKTVEMGALGSGQFFVQNVSNEAVCELEPAKLGVIAFNDSGLQSLFEQL